jgi:hypothetical protein
MRIPQIRVLQTPFHDLCFGCSVLKGRDGNLAKGGGGKMEFQRNNIPLGRNCSACPGNMKPAGQSFSLFPVFRNASHSYIVVYFIPGGEICIKSAIFP